MMDKDACGTRHNKNRCIEQSRLYPCLSCKKKKDLHSGNCDGSRK